MCGNQERQALQVLLPGNGLHAAREAEQCDQGGKRGCDEAPHATLQTRRLWRDRGAEESKQKLLATVQ